MHGLILFVIFTVVERRTENAIIDRKLFQRPAFLCSCVASWLLGFVFFLFLFIAAVYLQEELGYNALTAGIALVPFSLVLAVTGVMSGRLTKRFQLATLLIVSCAFMAVGLAILSFVPASYGYAGMVFTTRASTQADFDAWVASTQKSPSQLTLASYNDLAKPTKNAPPAFYVFPASSAGPSERSSPC